KFKGTTENRSMGGLGILPDSIHVNLQNPATYSSLKFTTYTIAGGTSSTNFKTDSAKDNASRTTLDYLAVALPFNKFGVAFGLMPYSSVGYRIQNIVEEEGLEKKRRYIGEGGLNRVFFGGSYKITPAFSVGVDFQYNFGNIETKSIIEIEDVIQYPTRELNDSDYSGVSFNIGAVYQTKFSQKYDWYAGATYTPESTLTAKTERSLATVLVLQDEREIVIDELDLINSEEKLKLPSKFTFGTGIGEARKWFAGAEYTFQGSNEFGDRFENIEASGSASFESMHRMAVGGYFIPNYNSYNSYLKRITYRAGLKFEKTGLVIRNEAINDYALSLGLGLPLGGIGGSNLNIGVEFGQRGTTSSGLVQENYTNIFISLSISDKWFMKLRYD
ncbi:MAG TPA: hypothetical protein VEA37_10520, partial [Flavobacterium sp.]|nr:hypothetical protein [Flavobacterium sp.]